MHCPTDDELASYVAGVSVPAIRRIALHVRACAACRTLLECLRSQSVDLLGTRIPSSDAWARALVGERLGRYQVLSLQGAGAMGIVLRAWEDRLQRVVAIRLLHGALEPGRALRLEALASAKLRHPNVVELFDIDGETTRPFLVMEFVEGASLHQWLESRRRADEILAVVAEAGRGLAYAHDEGVVHGDFKPDNVIVGADGRARVLDFGLAAIAREWTRRGAGTPAYMAPELLRGEASTPRSDQYAFAVMLHEALTGTRPFPASTVDGLLEQMLAPPAMAHASLLRPDVRPALRRALAMEGSERFGSMHDLLHALERSAPRRGRTSWWGLALGAAAIGGVVVLGGFADREPPCTEPAPVWSGELRSPSGIDADRWQAAARRLAAHQSAFDGAFQRACELRRRRDPSQSDRVVDCLARQRAYVEAFVHGLESEDAAVLDRIGIIAGDLPEPDSCFDEDGSAPAWHSLGAAQDAEVQALAEELSRARLATKVDSFVEGRERILAVAARARELDHAPLLAEVLVSAGSLDVSLGNAPHARRALEEGFYLAVSTGSDRIAFEAARSLAHLEMELLLLEAAAHWLRHAEWAIERLPQHARPLADLWSTQGNFAARSGRYQEARQHHERALAYWQAAEGDHRYVIALEMACMGYTHFDEQAWAQARRWFADSIELLEAVATVEHPKAAAIIQAASASAYLDGDVQQAIELGERALRIQLALSGSDTPAAAITMTNLAAMYKDAGRLETAKDYLERALGTIESEFGPESERAYAPNLNLGLVQVELGDRAGARRHLVAALEIARAWYGEEHERFSLAREQLDALGDAG